MSTILVCTWNVHECVGRDGRRDPHRVATILQDIGADLFALQEVHSDERGGSELDQTRFLAQAIGFDPVPGPTLERRGGRYGNLLLTRLPILSVRRHDLSVSGREARGALVVTVESPFGPLRVVATHLGLRAAERATQVRALLGLVGDPEPTETLVVLGDWNEWLPWGTALRLAKHRFGAVPAPPTFPAWRPVLALDRAWVRPRSRVGGIHAHRTALGAQASDHLPLVVRLLPPAPGREGAGGPSPD